MVPNKIISYALLVGYEGNIWNTFIKSWKNNPLIATGDHMTRRVTLRLEPSHRSQTRNPLGSSL